MVNERVGPVGKRHRLSWPLKQVDVGEVLEAVELDGVVSLENILETRVREPCLCRELGHEPVSGQACNGKGQAKDVLGQCHTVGEHERVVGCIVLVIDVFPQRDLVHGFLHGIRKLVKLGLEFDPKAHRVVLARNDLAFLGDPVGPLVKLVIDVTGT